MKNELRNKELSIHSDLEDDLVVIEHGAAALVKHAMRIRRKLELRGTARLVAMWTAAVMATEISPWCE